MVVTTKLVIANLSMRSIAQQAPTKSRFAMETSAIPAKVNKKNPSIAVTSVAMQIPACVIVKQVPSIVSSETSGNVKIIPGAWLRHAVTKHVMPTRDCAWTDVRRTPINAIIIASKNAIIIRGRSFKIAEISNVTKLKKRVNLWNLPLVSKIPTLVTAICFPIAMKVNASNSLSAVTSIVALTWAAATIQVKHAKVVIPLVMPN